MARPDPSPQRPTSKLVVDSPGRERSITSVPASTVGAPNPAQDAALANLARFQRSLR